MVLLGSTFWGLSGTAAQVLFHADHFQPAVLVSIRMIFSGLILVLWGMRRTSSATRDLARNKALWPRLLLFSIVGLLGVQFTYLKAIATGNAASATLLQYLGPSMIVAYVTFHERQRPNRAQSTAMLLSLLGTLLLVTGGHFQRLEVPLPAVIWGILSAVGLAFYTLQPLSMIHRYDAVAVVGWGMLVGGIASLAIGPVWRLPWGHWSVQAVLLTAFVVLLGTLAAFSLYLVSLHFLTPSESGLLATAEPVSAVLAAMLFLHVRLDGVALIGAVCIIAAVVRLSLSSSKSPPARS